MKSYFSAWRIFRSLSDENRTTAEHLLSRQAWPHDKEDLRIVDLGCGDGAMLAELLVASRQRIAAVHLVDPDAEFLRIAVERISSLNPLMTLNQTLGYAEDVIMKVTEGVQVILAIHLVYLLGNGGFKTLLKQLPIGVPFFLVLDERESVFQELWRRTALKYHQRVLDAHQIISGLSSMEYVVTKSEFDSHLRTPMGLRQDLRDAVLSMLCYTELSSLDDATREWVYQTIDRRTAAGKVVCDCACYEIIRRS